MNDVIKPAVLCVDDEPQVLSGLMLLLRRQFEVITASSGADGLSVIQSRRDIQVVMSDMRMPGMDGAAFLKEARKLLPDAPRILLTGNADLDAAIAAVNDGQIFRFLLKPCPPETVASVLQAAVDQYRLVTAERVLLGNTLNGTIKVLIDVLSMSHPKAFGHASRVKQLAGELAARVLPQHRWAVEMTAMLAPLGSISLPDHVVDKIYGGQDLSVEEKRMVQNTPALTESLLANIPRLELARAMLALLDDGHIALERFQLKKELQIVAQRGADILRVALDYDALDAAAHPTDAVIGTLKSRSGRYDPAILAALDDVRGKGGIAREIREVPVSGLREGMVIAADVRMVTGALLIARGFEVTAGLIERLRNLRLGSVVSPIKVYVPKSGT